MGCASYHCHPTARRSKRLITWFVAALQFFLGQMSTTQPGVLPRMVSDMTFAPDSPIPFPCKLQKHLLTLLCAEFNNSEQNTKTVSFNGNAVFRALCIK